MKRFYHIFFLIFTVLPFNFLAAQDFDASEAIHAKITATEREGMFEIISSAENTSAVHFSVSYIFVSIKKGNNNATNKQEGKSLIKAGQNVKLSETKINLDKNDALKVFLFVKNDENGKILSKDSLVINAASYDKSETTYLPEKNIELSGITIDETRTRSGKYFYDQFYMNFLQQDIHFSGTITINELAEMGRNTRITVVYNDQQIYSFMASPDEEFTENEAKKTVQILQNIFKTNTNVMKNL